MLPRKRERKKERERERERVHGVRPSSCLCLTAKRTGKPPLTSLGILGSRQPHLVSARNGRWLRALLYRGITAVVCARTDACEDRVRNYCVNLLLEAVNDPTKSHHLSRSFTIDNKGLATDANMVPPTAPEPKAVSKAVDDAPDDAIGEDYEDMEHDEDEEEEDGAEHHGSQPVTKAKNKARGVWKAHERVKRDETSKLW